MWRESIVDENRIQSEILSSRDRQRTVRGFVTTATIAIIQAIYNGNTEV